jgi:hypothetical protein
MTSIIERAEELLHDPTLGDRARQVIAAMQFRPVEESLTGEEIAEWLACLIMSAQNVPAPAIEKSTEGRVHSVSINDGVMITERIGG